MADVLEIDPAPSPSVAPVTGPSAPQVVPLTADRWADFVALFGPRGACAGCWCRYWQLPRSDYERGKGEVHRRAQEARLRAGDTPGVLAYLDGRPVGWCAVEPRAKLPTLARSRILAPVDDQPVWSIVCLFVARAARRRGVSRALIEGAVAFAASRGAGVVEAYPQEPGAEDLPDVFAFTGLASTYRACGFVEVVRRSPKRPVLRRSLPPAR
jgi:GNAT superfamily N-acetyltransferase